MTLLGWTTCWVVILEAARSADEYWNRTRCAGAGPRGYNQPNPVQGKVEHKRQSRAIVGMSKTGGDLPADVDLAGLINELPAAVIVSNDAGKIEYANARAEAILGYTREEFNGLEIGDLIPLKRRARHARLEQAFLRAPTPRYFEGGPGPLPALRKDGTVLPLHIALTSTPSAAGGVRVIAVLYDATEQVVLAEQEREGREALRIAESIHASLLETTHDLIWQCDNQGRFTYLSERWVDVLGYEVSEMLGKPFVDFMPEDEHERALAEFSRHMAGGRVRDFQATHLSRLGEPVICSSTRSPCSMTTVRSLELRARLPTSPR